MDTPAISISPVIFIISHRMRSECVCVQINISVMVKLLHIQAWAMCCKIIQLHSYHDISRMRSATGAASVLVSLPALTWLVVSGSVSVPGSTVAVKLDWSWLGTGSQNVTFYYLILWSLFDFPSFSRFSVFSHVKSLLLVTKGSHE